MSIEELRKKYGGMAEASVDTPVESEQDSG